MDAGSRFYASPSDSASGVAVRDPVPVPDSVRRARRRPAESAGRHPRCCALPEPCARSGAARDVRCGALAVTTSDLHEGILLLFRSRPALAAELLQLDVPADAAATLAADAVQQIDPQPLGADAVVRLDRHGAPVLAVVVEVQLEIAPAKRLTWPVYVAATRRLLGCPVRLLVVTVDRRVARWASRPIHVGPPGFVLVPEVLGPGTVPLVTDATAAARDPELSVLSAVAHGRTHEAERVAAAAIAAAGRLDEERARFYVDLILSRVDAATRRALEASMLSSKYQFQSDFAKKYIALGREEGREEGRVEGREEGREEGRVEAKVEALLTILAARGLTSSPAAEARIRGCRDLATLDRWLARTVNAATIEEALE